MDDNHLQHILNLYAANKQLLEAQHAEAKTEEEKEKLLETINWTTHYIVELVQDLQFNEIKRRRELKRRQQCI